MGLFGRKRRSEPAARGRHALPEPGDADYVESQAPGYEHYGAAGHNGYDGYDDHGGHDGYDGYGEQPRGATFAETDGPYDIAEAPDDSVARMDLGSVQVPVPEGAQVQVEMDQETHNVRAVHVVTAHGQATISAYAAPRTGSLWPDVAGELAEQLRSDGATVRRLRGVWGMELSVRMGDTALFFVGVDGPRWMLRGVIAGPQNVAEGAPEMLRALVRGTVVNRGDGPMPVRNPLPITLPPAIADHIAARQGE